ncbi:tetratricopeptide repeat protein [Thermomicrobium sp. CFH 73360]|uniref:tetratricopeptide repeat protein n=1 Tax=Thermomicrobium sp. CFH 73360 TaxID=2951987 RepID=UPI0020769ECB|nr:tetratricopeptide repeat protein [Thermomicrobium sp. CFH 73360]MCM8745631.1 tetratricopeptide repeat protein [Thermomicrobium sp. CFH 73360]
MSALSNHGSQERRLFRRLTQAAKQAAFQGEWQRAVELNRRIIELVPRDVMAWNRLGHAYAELGRVADARAAYQRALEIEPTNAIAQRNVTRLEWLAGQTTDGVIPMPAGRPAPRPDVFMEEMGRTYVTDLLRPAASVILARLFPGQEVFLQYAESAVFVVDADGTRLGQLEGRLARRLMRLWREGNQYRAFVLQLTGDTLRIILREVFRAPHLLNVPSFPPQPKIAPPRPYVPEKFRPEELEEEELFPEEEVETLGVEEEAIEIEEEETEVAEELLSTVDEDALVVDLDLDETIEG